jgi:hypothetical protein
MRLSLTLALALLAGSLPGEDVCNLQGISRVVAVGDVHGAYANFVKVLQLAGVVDQDVRWSAGKDHLVEVGDAIDRGTESRKVMDLLMRLEGEARKAGGRVHALLGNHEVMNLIGDLRYVTAEDYQAFQGRDSEARREEVFKASRAKAFAEARAAGRTFHEAAFREQFMKEVPLGFLEHREAFSETGTYGRWLRGHDAVARINGVVFLHGGLTPTVAALGCAGINARIRDELTVGFAKTSAAPLQSLAMGAEGPLWYRGLALEEEKTLGPAVTEALNSMGARAIVIGHTPTGDGRLRARFLGQVVVIDVGMVPVFGGHLAALEIGADGFVGLYPGGREPLLPTAASGVEKP